VSIATKRGDGGQTSLAGGMRVSKANPLVDTYGTIDELISTMGFARSICADEDIREATRAIQRELFKVGSALATPPKSPKRPPEIGADMVDGLTAKVHEIEAIEGVLSDWSIPGEDPAASAYDVARTVCRRAERMAVQVRESGTFVQPNVLSYLNRLSDLLWLYGRLIEFRAGKDSRLRDAEHKGPRWSRAW
jgi:cob(I)alamin adenosyltransferase